MARTNTRVILPAVTTHEGGRADRHQTPAQELARTVASCLLFEDTFYESGNDIAARIADLCAKVPADTVAAIAVKAREDWSLRHVPLWICRHLARLTKGQVVGDTIARVIQRADEMGELLALYWREERQPLSAQVKRGLALAFPKFDAYQLAKYDRDATVKLRDVMFLVHPKPKDAEQAAVWKKLVEGTLEAPDTWEVSLSAGKDKLETWMRLLEDKRLGGLALLRNLRNMEQAGVPQATISEALKVFPWAKGKVLPFRFIAAARYAPKLEGVLDTAMQSAMASLDRLPGRTLLVVDISGSMGAALGGKTEMTRIDAACALAILLRGVCDDCVVYATAGNDYTRVHATKEVPARNGMALRDAIAVLPKELGGGGIFMVQCMEYIAARESAPMDRVIIITDEQDCDNRPGTVGAAFNAKRLGKSNYVLNVAPYKPGLDTQNKWTRISGFSERVVDWIRVEETEGFTQSSQAN